jgi:hypothetical protein
MEWTLYITANTVSDIRPGKEIMKNLSNQVKNQVTSQVFYHLSRDEG